MFRIAFLEPQIAPNTGNAMRLVAGTGAELHLIGPLGFELDDAKLRRAGLDYRDLGSVVVHENLADFWSSIGSTRVFAFSSHARSLYTDIAYQPNDVLLFGTERTGLPADVLADRRITQAVRIPMLPDRRSLNLSNAASIAAYEAWRQIGFAGAAGGAAGLGGGAAESGGSTAD